MAKKRQAADGKPETPEKPNRSEFTSVRVSKAFARKMARLAKHKGKTVPWLIETWLADKIAEESMAMSQEMTEEFGH